MSKLRFANLVLTGGSAQTPMRLRRTTDDKNARSALECGREAAAFPWT